MSRDAGQRWKGSGRGILQSLIVRLASGRGREAYSKLNHSPTRLSSIPSILDVPPPHRREDQRNPPYLWTDGWMDRHYAKIDMNRRGKEARHGVRYPLGVENVAVPTCHMPQAAADVI